MATPSSVSQPMQKVRNIAARLILRAPRHQNCTPLLQQLHWLTALHVLQRSHRFRPLLSFWATTPLQSFPLFPISPSNTRILKLQHLNRKTHRFCTFSHFGPHIWNNYRKTSGNLLLPPPSKVNSRHFSSQNISVKHLSSTLLSVCTMCV